jgi:integrase/recombinase XerD
MSPQEATEFLKRIDISHVVDRRDRALIGVMVYAFARVSAVVALKVDDYFPLKKRWWLRLHEKGGKVNEMGCHHKLEEYLDAYIAAAGIAADKKGPLFRTADVARRCLVHGAPPREDAGMETAIGNHSFRAIGISDYLERGWDINIAKRMAGHSNVKTTELYDRRGDEVSFSEIERVGS